jgi:hypothetical protein
LDLSRAEALSDLPDDERARFARAAVQRELARDEEMTGFALALVLAGRFDLCATIVDAPARRFDVGAIVRARGTVAPVLPLRLVASSDRARVAVWDERSVEEAFRSCPWVEHELRAAGDRYQAEVGATMGPLGDRLDPILRVEVMAKLALRVLGDHEVVAARGKPPPGLVVVGAGELELVGDDGVSVADAVRAGDFLFPAQVLGAAPAPSQARAPKGGAIVLWADRSLTQELLVTCPPLLEILSG